MRCRNRAVGRPPPCLGYLEVLITDPGEQVGRIGEALPSRRRPVEVRELAGGPFQHRVCHVVGSDVQPPGRGVAHQAGDKIDGYPPLVGPAPCPRIRLSEIVDASGDPEPPAQRIAQHEHRLAE
jgi:hypothetical protein